MPECVVFFSLIMALRVQPPTAGYGPEPALELAVGVEMGIKPDPQRTR